MVDLFVAQSSTNLRAFKLGIACLIFFVTLAPAAARVEVEKLDAYFEQARQQWNVPGMAVAIVKDGEVVLAKGYGVKEMGRPERVNPETLFAIASNSKAFTALAIGILVDEGKIGWDDRVTKILPWFRLYDPYVTNEIRVRDLLCHRSGLGTFSGDLLWYQTSYDRKEVLQRVRYLEPTGSFRQDFGYSNLMFIAAGEIIAKVSGKSWDEFVRSRILEPLKMTQTRTVATGVETLPNVAVPHSDFSGTLEVYPWVSWEAAGAAAGIVSNANDMARWMQLQLGQGEFDGKRIVGDQVYDVLWTLHTSLPVTRSMREVYPSTHFRGYGLGWALQDYKGRKVVNHGGAYDGMFSRVALVPEERLGLVVLTNSNTSLPAALMYQVLDAYLDSSSEDWSALFLKRANEARERKEKQQAESAQKRVLDTHPSRELENYVGVFGGDLYGNAEITLEDGHLVLKMEAAEQLVADLEHWHFDTFELTWRSRSPWFGKGKVQFQLDEEGRVVEFVVDVPNEDFWFTELEFKRRK